MGGYSLSELGSIFVMQGFSGLSLFSVLLLMAIGLAIIFGQMGVINMAHGEFMTIGAYTTVMLSQVAEKYGFVSVLLRVRDSCRVHASHSLLGYLVEYLMIRRLYKRPLDTLLATWGLSLIMQQLFRSMFGAKEVSVTLPEWLMGSFKPTPDIDIPINGVFVMGLALLVTIGVYLFLFRSRWGLRVRATTQNRIMAGSVGINTIRSIVSPSRSAAASPVSRARPLRPSRRPAPPVARSTLSTASWWWYSAVRRV